MKTELAGETELTRRQEAKLALLAVFAAMLAAEGIPAESRGMIAEGVEARAA